jgi:hypothetical protein
MSRLLPILAIIFSIAIIFVYIRPTYSGTISDLNTKIDQYNDALEAAERFQRKEAELTQARAQIPPALLERLGQFLPAGVDNVQLILDMDALAARSGVVLSDFNIKSDAETSPDGGGDLAELSDTPVDSLNLTFKATGTYPAFRSFLEGIENSLRPLDVMQLTLNESTTGVYEYDVAVRIYWLR